MGSHAPSRRPDWQNLKRVTAAAVLAPSLSMGLATGLGTGLAAQSLATWGEIVANDAWLDESFTAIAAGGFHTVALRPDGTIAAWGRNREGACLVPPLPPGLTYTTVTAGYMHTLAIRSDGVALAWGDNYSHQCDVPALPPGLTYTGVAAGSGFSAGLRSDGSITLWGNLTWLTPVPTLPAGVQYTAISVAASGFHILALRSDGEIAAWGSNFSGQCNVPALPPGIQYAAVAAGESHSVALRSDGTIVTWGSSSWGLGAVPSGSDFVAVSAGDDFSVAVRSSGQLEFWGANSYGVGGVPTLPSGVTYVDVVGGTHHAVARRSDNRVVCWGAGGGACNLPRLPAGTHYEKVTTSDSGGIHALRSDGAVVSYAGWAGLAPAFSDYVDVSIGEHYRFLVRATGQIEQLAPVPFALPPPAPPPGLSFVQVDGAGRFDLIGPWPLGIHTQNAVALRSDGKIVSWGVTHTAVPPLPAGTTYVDVAATATYALAARSDGEVVQWGNTPAPVPPLPPGLDYVQVATTGNGPIALRSDGSAIGWGHAVVPPLPAGLRYVAVERGALRRSDGSFVLLDEPARGPFPDPPFGYRIRRITGGRHGAAILGPGSFETLGAGCAGSLPRATLTASAPPRLGATAVVRIDNLPLAAAIVALGTDATASALGPLPLELSALGLPGCTLRVAPEVMLFAQGTAGHADVTVTVPPTPTLVGWTLHLQALVLDPQAGNALGAALSDAATAVIGPG